MTLQEREEAEQDIKMDLLLGGGVRVSSLAAVSWVKKAIRKWKKRLLGHEPMQARITMDLERPLIADTAGISELRTRLEQTGASKLAAQDKIVNQVIARINEQIIVIDYLERKISEYNKRFQSIQTQRSSADDGSHPEGIIRL